MVVRIKRTDKSKFEAQETTDCSVMEKAMLTGAAGKLFHILTALFYHILSHFSHLINPAVKKT